ncbi:DnaA regulatory inactivator Hda [mine drainage metagenome]|jgi:DnaA family protein|uniref:DnaA regulatory inactivator Hda n=1 Tax=mine drainage metagenome TaxID=410659 RepID=A0A1J5QD97_9ZZZZ
MSGHADSQLLLDLQWDDSPRLDGFEPGANGIALQALRQLLDDGGALYLWGPPGSGRSHLLRAACAALQQRGVGALYLSPDAPPSHWPAIDAPGLALLAIDDVHDCVPWQQELLFGLYNALRQRGGGFLAAGDRAPAQLPLRDDLRTRLAWGLALALQPLDDAAKARVLQRIAAARGLELRDELSRYILTHHARDMRSLAELIDRLDAYALRHSRAASIPLLKEMLADADRSAPTR